MQNKQKKKNIKKNKSFWWIIVVGVLIIAAATFIIGLPGSKTDNALALEISVKEAHQLRDNGAFILDVREPQEWEAGHIPEATLIPLGELASRVDELPKDQDIVVVCRSGNRSASGRDILLKAGLSQVTSMAGGMNVWATMGYEIVTGN
jgi:rhodanese-related sulfurtransferase